MRLRVTNQLPDPDGLFADLLALHNGLSGEESALLNCRLILILINHIGDRQVIGEALRLAAGTAPLPGADKPQSPHSA